MLQFDIITIFPKIFAPILNESIIKRAQNKALIKINLHNLRDYSQDKHKKVDDRPYGGGAGMVMRPEPFFRVVEYIKSKINPPSLKLRRVVRRNEVKADKNQQARVILLTPQGERLNQNLAKKLSKAKHLILICGHYEGIDERVKKIVTDEISIGDYVLTGGELPALVVIDAVTRLVPGVLGDKESLSQETFEDNLLEYPHYTRPAVFKKMKVPEVLTSGNHKKIASWRKEKAIKQTKKKRPDLLNEAQTYRTK